MTTQAESKAPTVNTRAFHPYKAGCTDRILNNPFMSSDDVELIREFIEEKKSASVLNEGKKSFSQTREKRVLEYLRSFREFSDVDFREITLKDMVKAMPRLKNAKITDGKKAGETRFSQNTYRGCIAAVKMFLEWLVDKEYSPMTGKDLKQIGIPKANEKTITPADLLTDADRDAMIGACQNARDRCMVSLMYETGMRPCEIGTLTIKDVEFTADSMIVKTDKKTGRERNIPAPLSRAFMTAWLNQLPYKQAPDAIVFPSLTPTIEKTKAGIVRHWLPMHDDAVRRQIKDVAERAGVKNFRKLYQFRHTAISNWINRGIPDRISMKMSHGGETQCYRIYHHVTDDEVHRKVMEINDMVPKQTQKAPELKTCMKCGIKNPSTLAYCGSCGAILDAEKYEASIQKGDVKTAALQSELEALQRQMAEMVRMMGKIVPIDSLKPVTPVQG